MTDLADIWRFELRRGKHANARDGACFLEAVSWFADGTINDHPECVCPGIAGLGRFINDILPDAERQRLRAFIPRLIGTRDNIDVEIDRYRIINRQLARIGFVLPAYFPLTYLRVSREECDRLLCVLDSALGIGKQAEPLDPVRAHAAVERFAEASAR